MALRIRKFSQHVKLEMGGAQMGSSLMVALIFGGIIWAIFN
ncbi:hypothetical protein RAM80_29645 [Pseudomonas sp. App30]